MAFSVPRGTAASPKRGEEGNSPTGNASREILPLSSAHIWGAVGSGWGELLKWASGRVYIITGYE